MKTEVLDISEDGPSGLASIGRAVEVLAAGGLVVFPTETVYGVGARADRVETVARLRKLKERPTTQPLTLHIGSRDDVNKFVPHVPRMGRRMIRKGWPGPLTLVFDVENSAQTAKDLNWDESVSSVVYVNGSVGVRCPDHAKACSLLQMVDAPVVATSANRRGERPPRTVDEVLEDLDGEVDLILNDGATRYAKASTVVRVGESRYELLRAGVYDERTLRSLMSVKWLFVCTGNTCRSPMAATLCRKLMADHLSCDTSELEDHGIWITSAGVFAGNGMPASAEAIEAISRKGVDLSQHRSRPLTREMLQEADRIFAMTSTHLATILDIAPEVEGRARTLIPGKDIDDPVGGPLKVYEACAEKIESGLAELLREEDL